MRSTAARLMSVVLGAGLVVSALWFLWPDKSWSTAGLKDPNLVTATRHQVAELALPAGWIADPTDTACLGSVDFCATTSDSPAVASGKAAQVLKTSGFKVRHPDCTNELADLGIDCRAEAAVRKVPVALIVFKRNGLGYTYPRTSIEITVLADKAETLPPSAPIGDWTTLNLVPAGWTAQPSCSKPIPHDCREYKIAISSPDTPEVASNAFLRRLNEQGFRVDVHHCSTDGCTFAATKYRSNHGRDILTCIASVRPSGTTSTGRITLVTSADRDS